MIFVLALVLTALTLAPLALFTWRGARMRGRQEAALALHRAQLTELDRDLADGRLLPAEHEAAKLEVQRRLLADAALPDAATDAAATDSQAFVWITAGIVPVAAIALYLTVGRPGGPPPDSGQRGAPAGSAPGAPPNVDPAKAAKDEAMIGQLRNRLALMDPHAPNTIKGYLILGNAELSMGHLPEAAAAWQRVLEDHFDPTLAAEVAEVMTETAGHVTPEALALFKRAVAEAPSTASWRKMAERRIAESAAK